MQVAGQITALRRWHKAVIGALALGGSALAGPALWQTASASQAAPAARTTMLAAPTVRFISEAQYRNIIAQVFGPDISVEIRLAPVNRVNGLLAVGARDAFLSPGVLAPLDSAARSVANQVIDAQHRQLLIPCRPANAAARDDACARTFLGASGRLLFRRKLAQPELAAFVDLAGSIAAKNRDFYSGISSALSGMLLAPDFLYIRDTVQPDPAAPGAFTLDAYSRASRLSFLLWNSAPDDALLQAAEDGSLGTPKGIRAAAERMLASARYREGVRAFFADFLVTEKLDSLSKDAAIYPDYLLTAARSAKESLLRTVVDHLVDQKGDYRDLFTTRKTFVNGDLGLLYGVPAPGGASGWSAYEFPAASGRAGILTQVAFLSAFSHAGRSSPTQRGRGLREILLCQQVPNAPPNVDFSNFENPASPLPTARLRLTRHQENPVCAGCHKLTDPIGLSLEKFDGAGQSRMLEAGHPIDTSGSLDGVKFEDAAGLGMALRNNAALKACIVDRLYAYSNGRKVEGWEEPRLKALQAGFETTGYSFEGMLKAIIFQPGFFSVGNPLGGPANMAAR